MATCPSQEGSDTTVLKLCHMVGGHAHGMEAGYVPTQGWYFEEQSLRLLIVSVPRHILGLTMERQWLQYFLKISIVNLKCLRKRNTNGQSLVRAAQWQATLTIARRVVGFRRQDFSAFLRLLFYRQSSRSTQPHYRLTCDE